LTGFAVKPVIALESNIQSIINEFFTYDNMGKIIHQALFDKTNLTKVIEEAKNTDINETKNAAPVERIVTAVIEEAVKQRASDIHIEPQESHIFIRFRIDGMLHTVEALPIEIHSFVTSKIKILGSMDISERRMPQDGQTSFTIQKRNIDLRISTLPGKYGEKIVLRILDKSNFSLGVEHLGFLPDEQTLFEELLNSRNGIILVTGPTGSGKSTTLYSAVNRIKSSTKNIITLEDPIEYELLSGKNKECGITQVQINPKSGLTFATTLRACLRQDPDVIFLGEIRDGETCGIAINAALTGHLVLSSLHTNDSVSTITRLLDMNVEPYLISSSLIGVVAQRLIRALCPQCKEKYIPPKNVLSRLSVKSAAASDLVFYRPKGCKFCNNSGYKGRTGVFELLLINDKMRDMILAKESLTAFRMEAKKTGMNTMRGHAIELVARGITSMAEVMRTIPFDV
jgi:type IV pilus assembly protein PilB